MRRANFGIDHKSAVLNSRIATTSISEVSPEKDLVLAEEQKYAIKIINKDKIRERQTFIKLLTNELAVLAWYDHPNLMKVEDIIEDKYKFYIVSEVLWGGPVISYVRRNNRLPED